MKDKVFRVNGEIAQEITEMTVEYITRNGEITTEAKMLEAIICIGKEKIKNDEIDKYLKSKE
jgi:hypothetical protein|tara:strand:- start:2490 stop:2675 length:186 start_codon:yes stop_codon:yes gene_type:complete